MESTNRLGLAALGLGCTEVVIFRSELHHWQLSQGRCVSLPVAQSQACSSLPMSEGK